MSTIEHVVETAAGEQPDYSGREFTAEEIREGAHRAFIGGVWDTHGETQVTYLRSRGLRPEHRLLDIGCGPFRAGRHFIDYLEAGHYYGVDANQSLMQAGWDTELSDEQRAKLPVEHLRATDRFAVEFVDAPVDFAIAQSVFTHVSLNHIRLCLFRLGKTMDPGGSFYATFFERSMATTPLDHVIPSKKGKPFFCEKNVFWYYKEDLAWAAEIGPWEFRYIGDWGHPANQKMAQFVRLTDQEAERRKQQRAATRRAAVVPGSARRKAAHAIRRGRRWAARAIDPGPGR